MKLLNILSFQCSQITNFLFSSPKKRRTVDASVFKPIVSINSLTAEDCLNLHLIAVTQSGVRLYFSTVSVLESVNSPSLANVSGGGERPSDHQQPNNLYLLHVRLPPGYTANATVGKPKLVHSSFHSSGTILMVSSAQQDQDLLWSLSSEPFPLRPYLAESSTVMPLNGQVWAIAEVRDLKFESALVTPLKISRTNKRIVLLTNQGAYVIALIKPMGLLMQLLAACHGPHHEAVKSYFQVQSETQACVSSLLLACMDAYYGTDIGLWATQAFLIYGGEPQLPNRNQQLYNTFNGKAVLGALDQIDVKFFQFVSMQLDPQMNSPNMVVSTPYPMNAAQQRNTPLPYSPVARPTNIWSSQQTPHFNQQQPQDISYSAKHSSLYLYVGRLLRPIWKKKCVILPQCQSTISHEDCAVILDDLYALKTFLDAMPMSNMSGELKLNDNANDEDVEWVHRHDKNIFGFRILR